jgi:hypothetical protein
MRALFGVLLLAPLAGSADLIEWFPLRPGARWVYDCESRNGDRRHPIVDRWRETVTVTAHLQTPEGLVILRDFAITGHANPRAGFPWNRVPVLWRGNCLYPLYPEMWDASRRSFTLAFSTMLAQLSPDVCFPLDPGAYWKSGADWGWRVDGRGPLARGPQDVPSGAIRIVQETSAGPNYFWYEKGVGPVAAWSWHNGTYTEQLEKLVATSVRH